MIAAFAFVFAAILGPCWPPPVSAAVSQPFQAPACRWCAGHQALGYTVPSGTVVRAVAPGAVVFSGQVAGVGYVTLRHADGVRATYGGLRHTPTSPGQIIAQGQPIGVAAGLVTFSLRAGDRYLDPTGFLARWRRRPSLVPTDSSRARAPSRVRLECLARVASR